MPKYTVKFYTGDYGFRQRSANKDKALCYIEQHFNAAASPNANYCLAVTGSNASQKSINMAASYVDAVETYLGIPKWSGGKPKGVAIGGISGRGDSNLIYTNMPAVLLEPLFVTTPAHVYMLKERTNLLAVCVVDMVREHFPNGGLIGFSIGHKGKSSNPKDRGAAVYGGGTEADFAEMVLNIAKALLERDIHA